ncbi:MAG TPA: sigma-70 family RNA polymerase sigma factor [Pyrinomonadaceae bacterium]|nr:sigma-70 family RNA polymerase sigma factor [Pyrinomonadaceae bacterium]
MDNLLLRLLNARDEPERRLRLHELLTIHVAPIARQVLRQRLGFYVSAQGVNETNRDAEDLYQEVLTRVVEVLNADQRCLTTIENFEGYVNRTASNICFDFLRSKYPTRFRQQQLESLDDHVEATSRRSVPSAESDLESHELLGRLWLSIKRLTPKQRDAFVLRFQDHDGRNLFTVLLAAGIVDWKDLAEAMDRSAEDLVRLWTQMPMDTATAANELRASRENVYKWLYRAIQKLKGELE